MRCISGAFLLFYCALATHAQVIQFEQVHPINPKPSQIADFVGVKDCDIEMGDVDQDGDIDVIVSGNMLGGIRTHLYLNDGDGNFNLAYTEKFPGYTESQMVLADLDGDTDLDLILGGNPFQGVGIIGVNQYLNDGNGHFAEVQAPFQINNAFKMEEADLDGDNDIDLFIASFSGSFILLNNGSGQFLPDTNTFMALSPAAIALADFDGNGFVDVVLQGYKPGQGGGNTAAYYRNFGGNFIKVNSYQFPGLTNPTITIGDANNDGLPDIYMSGDSSISLSISRIYFADSSGNFIRDNINVLPKLKQCAVGFVDLDNDNDLDLLLSGSAGSSSNLIKIYRNNGFGYFFEDANQLVKPVHEGAVRFGDVDNDGFTDAILAGNFNMPSGYKPITRLYMNNGSGLLKEANGDVAVSMGGNTSEFADLNNDGYPDYIQSGRFDFSIVWNNASTNIFVNDTLGNFTQLPAPSGICTNCKIKIGDINGDSYLDLVTLGENGLRTYINNGSANFTQHSIVFSGSLEGAIAVGDIDNDGDLDLVVNGYNSGPPSYGQYYSKVFRNNGAGIFTADATAPFQLVWRSSSLLEDIDDDGDLDLFLTGNNTFAYYAQIYLNDSLGNFMLKPNTNFTGVQYADAQFGDVDGNGKKDLLYTGSTGGGTLSYTSKLYLQDTLGNFSEVQNLPFPIIEGEFEFVDIDNDADLDVFAMGQYRIQTARHYVSNFFVNDGAGNFAQYLYTPFDTAFWGKPRFADVNKDGLKDVLIMGGHYQETVGIAKLYLQDTSCTSNVFVFDTITGCPGGYVWPIDGCTYTQAGDYYIYKTFVDACDTVNFLNLSIKPVDVGATRFGITITATATNATFQWWDCTNRVLLPDTGRVFTATANGWYAPVVTQYNCLDTGMCILISQVGIPEIEKGGLAVYPNPTTGTLRIEPAQSWQHIEVYDVAGRWIADERNTGQDLNFTYLPAGLYVLHIKTKDGWFQTKLVKQE